MVLSFFILKFRRHLVWYFLISESTCYFWYYYWIELSDLQRAFITFLLSWLIFFFFFSIWDYCYELSFRIHMPCVLRANCCIASLNLSILLHYKLLRSLFSLIRIILVYCLLRGIENVGFKTVGLKTGWRWFLLFQKAYYWAVGCNLIFYFNLGTFCYWDYEGALLIN